MKLTNSEAKSVIQRMAACAGLRVCKLTSVAGCKYALFSRLNGSLGDVMIAIESMDSEGLVRWRSIGFKPKSTHMWKQLLDHLLSITKSGKYVFVVGNIDGNCTRIPLMKPYDTLDTVLIRLDLHEVPNEHASRHV